MEVVLLVVFSIITILNLIPNRLVVIVVARYKPVQSSINYLFLNVALADILVATSLIPQYILRPVLTHPDGWAGTLLCKLFTRGFTMWVAETAATATHVVIAIERFYTTRRPEIRASKMRGGKLKLVIAGAWIFAVLSEVPLLYVMTSDNKRASCYETWAHPVHAKTYSAFTFTVDFAIPLIIMVVLYSKAVAALRRGSIIPQWHRRR